MRIDGRRVRMLALGVRQRKTRRGSDTMLEWDGEEGVADDTVIDNTPNFASARCCVAFRRI